MPATSFVCHTLSFTWPTGELVFENLDCTFPAGKTGLIGRNGVGKSTLLRLLAGEYRPTAGAISAPAAIGYLPQDLTLDATKSVADLLGIAAVLESLARIDCGNGQAEDFDQVGDDWDLPERVQAELARFGFAELPLDRPISTLSGGEVILLALAALFLRRPEVLLLDEPTNNLDHDARQRLYAAVDRWRGAVIIVSHDRELLELVDQIGELRAPRLTARTMSFYGGNFSAYLEALAIEREAADRAVRSAEGNLKRQQRELAETRIKLDRRQRFAKSQQDNVPKIIAGGLKRKAEVSAGKLRGSHEAEVEAARHSLEEAEERVRSDESIRIDLSATAVPPAREVLIMNELVLRNGVVVNAHLRGPDRVGLTGANGSGKTTLIDTICGQLAAQSGECSVKVPLRLLPQRLQVLAEDESVIAGVSALAPSADNNTLRAQLARFLLDADTIARPVCQLSGGERFRASLAALLLSEPTPQLLILDEPTNNLDLDSVAQLTAALQQYRGALLVSSHDQRFLEALDLTGQLAIADGVAELQPWPDSSNDFGSTLNLWQT